MDGLRLTGGLPQCSPKPERTSCFRALQNDLRSSIIPLVIETVESYPHLAFRKEDGFPVVERVGFKAIHLIANHVAHGWSAEELAVNFPSLKLGEVYCVLAWFSDHRDEVMSILESRAVNSRALALEERHQQIAARLRESGRLTG